MGVLPPRGSLSSGFRHLLAMDTGALLKISKLLTQTADDVHKMAQTADGEHTMAKRSQRCKPSDSGSTTTTELESMESDDTGRILYHVKMIVS